MKNNNEFVFISYICYASVNQNIFITLSFEQIHVKGCCELIYICNKCHFVAACDGNQNHM
jgi:hypothetical protein